MSKSISKLIIAGMALSLAVPVGAFAQQKVSKSHTTRTSVTSRVQPAPAGKHLKLMDGSKSIRTIEDKSGAQFAKAGKFTRSINFKLDRQSAPLHVTASEPLNGVVIFADDWTNDYQPAGVYSIPTDGASNEVTEIALVSDMAGAMSGVAVGDRYYTSTLETFWGLILGAYISVYDVNTWELVEMVDCADDLSRIAINYAYDATSDKVYGQFYTADASGVVFGEFDPDTYTVTPIAQSSVNFNVMTCAADGTIYAIGFDGNLYTISKDNGNMTLIGSTGYASAYYSSGAIDTKTGKLYWNICGDPESYIAEVNTATAETTILYQLAMNEEIVGMWSPKPAAEEGAPAQVSDFKANFGEGQLTGKLSFTAPATLFDGSAATGDFTYVIKANGEEIATGTVAAGAEVSFDYTVPASGTYKFTAYCENEVGKGPSANISMYVGVDIALAPTNVKLAYADETMTLTWDAAQGAHAGYIGEVTYTVTRYETGKEPVVVKEGLTECTYTEKFVAENDDLRNVYYTVAAVTSEGETQAVASNSIGMGCITPPYSNSFVTNSSLTGYTLIDGNGDGKVWTATTDGLRMSYNSSVDMDDWAITPAVKLEAGKLYMYSVVVANNSSNYSERIEVKAGKAPEASAMTIEVIAPTDVQTGGQNITLDGSIMPEEAGEYYIGIHGISDPDQFYLYVREYSISNGVSPESPAKADDIEIAAGENSFFEATVSFTAPTTNAAGGALTSIDKIEVTRSSAVARSSEVVFTATNPNPGEEISFVDAVEQSGTYTYTIVATNADGAGLVSQMSAYIGVPVAAAPAEATVEATDNFGEVVIAWEPVTESVDGVAIPAKYITYTVVNNASEVIAEGLTDCTLTYQALTEGQEFVYYGVYAVTDAGKSARATTSMIPVGTPYELPFKESFDDATLSYIWGVNQAGGGQWAIASNETFSDVTDADDSNGFAYMKASYVDDSADLFTGLITLNAEDPALKFAFYNLGEADTNVIDILVTCDGKEETAGSVVMNDNNAQTGWNTALVSLKAYAGKTVQVTFRAIAKSSVYTIIDAISIDQLEDYNLELVSVNGPAEVKAGETFAITADVLNMGAKAISDYKVELYHNGALVDVKDGVELATSEKATFSFEQEIGVTGAEENIYTVHLACDLDPYQDDNTVEYPVIMVLPNYPVAKDLKATYSNNKVDLTWSEPDTENLPKVAVTEDFESYDAWAIDNLGDWTLVDEDGLLIGGVQGVQFGPIVPGETMCAYFVMNDTDSQIADNDAYLAHSGHQYLVSTFSYSGGANADWLISPELSGDAQTITFYARSFNSSYGLEDFQVLYSKTDNDIASFTEAAEYIGAPTEWTAYSVNLPAGTKYFAIKCISDDKFMFFLDDVTYVPANSETMDLSIVGYNIYRNGVKINDAPVAETNYVDFDGTISDFYCVTVVYTVGESAPSLTVGVGSTSGIDDIVSATAVKVAARTIVVTNAQGTVAVYAADGKAVYNEAAAKTNTVTVAPGVYVVKAGETVTKVIVK